jgi:beta-aspartyl-peptidase (threonine type)
MMKPVLVIHGGAGKSPVTPLSAEDSAARTAALAHVLSSGFAVLRDGGSALDAVTVAVTLLEDCPFFNAGHGAVITAGGGVELDASIMDGTSGKAGGVSAVRTIKNPILAARAVMERTAHTLLCAEGADNFAAASGLAIVDNEYFKTAHRMSEWEAMRDDKVFNASKGLGTVGAVAMDAAGALAAATSTGGLTNKMLGRVSDSSVPGAGTWARNGVCALSCTGTGDIFIRNNTAFDAAAMVQYRGFSLDESCRTVLAKVKDAGGEGGIIGIDAAGRPVMDFNTGGMNRGWISDDAGAQVFLL